MSYSLKVGSRGSPLARTQVAEVLQEIRYFEPGITFEPLWIETTGDRDLTTPLTLLDKTNFFTKEIDEGLLRGDFRIAIHSAKDLPSELPEGLEIIAITAGQDARDALVGNLFPGARVGLSSKRREEMLRKKEPSLIVVDIRGPIERRLALLDEGYIDAVVIAEAALLRLKIARKREILEGETAALQGQLAIVARSADEEMKTLFSALDTRKKTVYFGINPRHHPKRDFLTHCPLIETVYYPDLYPDLSAFTTLIVTSQTASYWLLQQGQSLQHLQALCVGPETARPLQAVGVLCHIAKPFQAEGVIDMLPAFRQEKIFYPHSAKARPLIKNYLSEERFDFCALPVYDTLYKKPNTSFSLEEFDEFFFTSSSTVEAFVQIYKKLPENKILRAIGPVTKETLQCHTNFPIYPMPMKP